jgi:hypothetical protein
MPTDSNGFRWHQQCLKLPTELQEVGERQTRHQIISIVGVIDSEVLDLFCPFDEFSRLLSGLTISNRRATWPFCLIMQMSWPGWKDSSPSESEAAWSFTLPSLSQSIMEPLRLRVKYGTNPSCRFDLSQCPSRSCLHGIAKNISRKFSTPCSIVLAYLLLSHLGKARHKSLDTLRGPI